MCTFKYKTNSSLRARLSGYPFCEKKYFKNEEKNNCIPGVFPQQLDKFL